jgi:hypothetical protein
MPPAVAGARHLQAAGIGYPYGPPCVSAIGSAVASECVRKPRDERLRMRIILAAIFAIIGVPLILSALATLASAPSITHQTFAMLQIVAGLLCFLIAVVAGLMRPTAREPAEAPKPATPATPAPSDRVRDGLGMAVLVVSLAVGLIVLAVQLRTPGRDRAARAGAPEPRSGSMPGTVRSMTPAVTPEGKSESGRTAVKARSLSRPKAAMDDD